MTNYKQGDLVTLYYPFDDFSDEKMRPAIVVGKSRSKVGAYIVVKVTTTLRQDANSFLLRNEFLSMPTRKMSEARCNEIITISERRFIRRVSTLDKSQVKELCLKIQQNFTVD